MATSNPISGPGRREPRDDRRVPEPPWDSLRRQAENADTHHDVDLTRGVMLALIVEVEHLSSSLPVVGAAGLLEASKQWRHGPINQTRMADARVEIWKYMQLKNGGDSAAISDNEDRSLRALLSVLYPPNWPEDPWFASDAVDWFCTMIED